jgi:hypothetical protein
MPVIIQLFFRIKKLFLHKNKIQLFSREKKKLVLHKNMYTWLQFKMPLVIILCNVLSDSSIIYIYMISKVQNKKYVFVISSN